MSSEKPTGNLLTPTRRGLLAGAATLSAAALLPQLARADAPPTAQVNTTGLAVTDTEVTVGILHSVTGTMAISETGSVEAEKLAIEQINAQGGVLGRKIKFIQEDGASDWPTFAEKAKKLLVQDKCAAVMGCWTSASRKAVLPVFEQYNGMLYYPTFYEGLEQSKNVIYTGQEATQQILAGLNWVEQGEGRQDLLPARLRLHLAAHVEQDRAQAHRELPQAQGRRRGIFPARQHAVQLRHQQDQAEEAGRDLRDHRRRLQRRLLQAAQGGRHRPHQADAADDLGHRGRNPRHRRREHRRRLCLHEILPVARQSQQQGVRPGVQEDVGREDRDRRRHAGRLSRPLAVEADGGKGRQLRHRQDRRSLARRRVQGRAGRLCPHPREPSPVEQDAGRPRPHSMASTTWSTKPPS